MGDSTSLSRAMEIMRNDTGIVIPVYLPEGVDTAHGEALVRDNVETYCQWMADPKRICLSVDGKDFGRTVAESIAADRGVSLCVQPVNRGKLHAVMHGMRVLLDGPPSIRYLAVVDQDGDHFANDFPMFLQAAEHIAARTGNAKVLVNGRRSSPHRTMGLLRGELEVLADRVLMDALQYRAAATGRPLSLEYANAYDEFVDFHSGYKVFTRPTAKDVFLPEPRLCGVPDNCYYRHAVEAVMTVEALEAGAYLGVVTRGSFNGQPFSTFGLLERTQLMADMMIWPCKRLEIPTAFVRQWVDNHIPRLLLDALAPDGKRELREIRRLVRQAFPAAETDEDRDMLEPVFA